MKIRPEYFHFFLYWKWSYYKIRHWGLNCWGSDGSLDTHIYLVTYFICHLLSAIYVSHLSFMTDGMNVRWQITKGTWLIWLSLNLKNPKTKIKENFILNQTSWRSSGWNYSLFKFICYMTTLEKNVLDPTLLRFSEVFSPLLSYAILQEYDNETAKVGPFNQPYLMASQVTEWYRVLHS